MPRYQDEYGGMAGEPRRPEGLDPNHRAGYQGMRMYGGSRQAAYGWHRWTHPRDFQGSGGFEGRYGRDFEERPRGRLSARSGGYDREMRGGGGVHDLRNEPEHLREFNADSIRFREEGRGPAGGERYARDFVAESRRRRGRGGYDSGLRRGYSDRGMSDQGYGEAWTWGPMRGSR